MRACLAALFLTSVIAFAASLPSGPVSASGWHATRGVATEDRAITHDGQPSVRLEPASPTGLTTTADAVALSAPVSLTVGRWYDLSGFIRTDAVEVRDIGRSPIAVGAAIAMASMPFDVHSESLGGTRPWTPVHLRFQATSPHDEIVLMIGRDGRASGKAWFSGIRLAESDQNGLAPSKASVRTFGPAYRYPAHGWIYLHIEGAPYDRGFQHGFLMSKEIQSYIARCAAELDSKDPRHAWDWARTQSDALFLRGYDEEIKTEMRGIAEGAAAAGATWHERRVDLLDIVAENSLMELELLSEAMPMTPTGIESLQFNPPSYFDPKRDGKKHDTDVTEHCSAFAATGPATRDGKMRIGHITMWDMTLSEQTNVMLDIKPAAGHRILMQSYPGGIQSGTDWLQNDLGLVLTETTIRQSPFNIDGLPEAFRSRKAMQYGDSIEKVAEILGSKNNGMYTNEWLIGDGRTNEIAMYELGTYKSKLYRSSKNEWFGNTAGFYWGDNNAKDLQVRLEYAPDPHGRPAFLPYVPNDRDLKWMELYRQYEGRIDDDFGFTAFRSAPLVTWTSIDAKVTTGEMAKNMMVWASFGKPNEREWAPDARHQQQYPMDDGIYPGGYTLFAAAPSPALVAEIHENEQARLTPKKEEKKKEDADKDKKKFDRDLLWKGWILPASGSDNWLVAGSALYYSAAPHEHFDRDLNAWRAQFRAASLKSPNAAERYRMETTKGALLIDALRHEMGDDKFFAFMKKFFADNTTKTVQASAFIAAAGPEHQALFNKWLGSPGIPDENKSPIYIASEVRPLNARLANVVIVYGTQEEAGANRYAAEMLQARLTDLFEDQPVIRKDFEVSPDLLRDHDVIFVGRPETNIALAAWSTQIHLPYDGTNFDLEKKSHGDGDDGLIFAAANPLDDKHMVIVVAGNSPVETVRLSFQRFGPEQFTIYNARKDVTSGFPGGTGF